MKTARASRRGAVVKAAEFKAKALAIMRRVHETGEPVTVTSHGKELVRIEPARAAREPKGYGCMKGTFELLVPLRELEAPLGTGDIGETLREWDEEFGE
jgi:prevent-host-death family protein